MFRIMWVNGCRVKDTDVEWTSSTIKPEYRHEMRYPAQIDYHYPARDFCLAGTEGVGKGGAQDAIVRYEANKDPEDPTTQWWEIWRLADIMQRYDALIVTAATSGLRPDVEVIEKPPAAPPESPQTDETPAPTLANTPDALAFAEAAIRGPDMVKYQEAMDKWEAWVPGLKESPSRTSWAAGRAVDALRCALLQRARAELHEAAKENDDD